MPTIYQRQGDVYIAMQETPYNAEDVLQALIENHPEVLAGDDAPHGRMILVKREAGVSEEEGASTRWSLDHLYLDARGIPTLVEVKRSSDTRSRREVVAQMLDYAANAKASFSAERMAEWLEESALKRNSTGDQTLHEAFGVNDVEAFWQTVDTNLEAERFRLVFVADRIGGELRRIIEFLNRQMTQTEVLAIEVKQYTDADDRHQTIVPRVVGDTSEARAVKRRSGRMTPLDRDTLVARLSDHDSAAGEAAEALLHWAETDPRVEIRYTGTGAVIETAGRPVLKLWANPRWIERALEFHVETLIKHGEPWDEKSIADLLRTLRESSLKFDRKARWPMAPVEGLADEDSRNEFLALVDEVLKSVAERESASGP